MSDFKIDFIELMFLAEVCIPPNPIARSRFWDDLIDKHYHKMSDKNRLECLEWITSTEGFDMENKDCQRFYARYNPENQYRVKCEYEGEILRHKAYKFHGRFMINKTTSIIPKYILKAEKINKDD